LPNLPSLITKSPTLHSGHFSPVFSTATLTLSA